MVMIAMTIERKVDDTRKMRVLKISEGFGLRG